MRLKLLLYILLCLPAVAFSQSITVQNVDVSAYPVISADVFIFDKEGLPVHNLGSADLELTVNTMPTPIQGFTCPPPQPPLPMWAVIACDRSQSMNERINDDLLYIDLATAGMSAFVKSVDFTAGDTRVALMVFDTAAKVLINFSSDAVLLGTKVGGISPIDVAGTNYNRAFLDPFEGAITLLKRVPPGYERVLVLLSDGAPTVGDFDYSTILQEVVDNKIVVYPIIIKEAPSYQLQQLAFHTGGQAFGGIVTREEVRSIYSRIAKRAQLSKAPCKMTWEVNVCDTTRRHTARLRNEALDATVSFTYNLTAPLKTAKVSAGRDTTICDGTTVTLRAVGNSTKGTYLWLPSDGLSDPTSAAPVLTPTTATSTYTVVFTDDRGCSASDEVTVNVLSPTVSIPVDSVFICRGESVALSANGNGERYLWSPAAGLDQPVTNATVVARPVVTTTYDVTMWLGSCSVRDTVTVVVVDLQDAIDIGPDVAVCADSSVLLTPTGIEGRYHWFPAEGLNQTDIRTPTARPAQTTKYYLTVTTASGCTASDSITVTVHSRPVVNAGADTDICPGKSTVLTAQGLDGDYQWSPATGLDRTSGRTVTASPLSTTVYTVLYTDPNGCKAADEVTVVVNGALVIDAGEEQATCPGGSVQLAVTGSDGTAVWTPAAGLNDPNSRTPVASPAQTTVYTVVVTSPEGCIGTDNVTVVVHPQAVVEAGNGAVICRGESTGLSATGTEGTYQWSPETGLDNPKSPNPTASPSKTTTYTVVVTDGNGCSATDNVTVTVRSYADITFSLARKETTALEAGIDGVLMVQLEGIDITQDTITSFECELTYDMASLQYRPGTVLAGSAASGWSITAIEQDDKLIIRGTGDILAPGTICTFVVRPYLSQTGASTGRIGIRANSASVEAKGCVTTSMTGITLPVSQPCITASRAIRYTGKGFGLQQNIPNPARDAATIEFSVAFRAPTNFALYNSLGEQVMLLVDDVLDEGGYSVALPVNDLPSGLYYYRLTSGPYSETRQMIIAK